MKKTCSSVWRLCDAAPSADVLHKASFDSAANRAWHVAARAVGRTLPVLWGSLDESKSLPHCPEFIDSFPLVDRECPIPDRTLDGRSFGLPFALALASRVLDLSFAHEFAATGEVDASGAVRPIGGLLNKAKALRALCPDVRYLLVPAEQDDAEVTEIQRECEGLQLIRMASCRDAFRWAFKPGGLSKALIRSGRDPVQRGELVERFFGLALNLTPGVVNWGPIARAADVALRNWVDLDAFHRWQLTIAREVARRHADNVGHLKLPPAKWFGRLGPEDALSIVAHLIQQCADSGYPEASTVRRFAQQHLQAGTAPTKGELAISGALARLEAVTGFPARALARQEASAIALKTKTRAYDELSYPLSEWFRLAGTVGDQEAFARAEALRSWCLHRRPVPKGMEYVDLAWGRSAVLFGLGLESGPVRRLGEMSCDVLSAEHGVPSYLAWSALRWWRRAGASGEKYASALQQLRDTAATKSDEQTVAKMFLSLIDLDIALAKGNSAAASRLLARVRKTEPGVIGHLERWAVRARKAPAAHVALHYPY